MSRQVQALGRVSAVRRSRAGIVAVLASTLMLAACGSRGVTLEDIAVDTTLVTGSIKPETTKPPADQVSDEVTVRNAVSSADIRRIEALPWANASTGSQGSISAIMQTETNGVICRSFTTTRESFRGVAIYKGETCRGFDGEWLMRSFVES